jgi:hypothetical protein
MQAGSILGGAPIWVYILLAGLIALGVRRLKPREVPLIVALIPVTAFLLWSLIGALNFAQTAGAVFAAAAWVSGIATGVVSAFVLPEARAKRIPGGRILLPGSWMPLILYMTVFIARFACGAWAAMVPAQAMTATAIGIAIGAALTGRLAMWVVSWEKEDAAAVATH